MNYLNDRKSLCEGCFQSHVNCEIENFLSPTQFADRERESCTKALLEILECDKSCKAIRLSSIDFSNWLLSL